MIYHLKILVFLSIILIIGCSHLDPKNIRYLRSRFNEQVEDMKIRLGVKKIGEGIRELMRKGSPSEA